MFVHCVHVMAKYVNLFVNGKPFDYTLRVKYISTSRVSITNIKAFVDYKINFPISGVGESQKLTDLLI